MSHDAADFGQDRSERQTLFFTATWNANVQKIAADFLNKPYQVGFTSGMKLIHLHETTSSTLTSACL